MNTGRTRFKKGHKGYKKKGCKHQTTSVKEILEIVFAKNREKAIQLANDMFSNKHDFKWLVQIKAQLEPKEINGKGLNGAGIIIQIIQPAESKDTNRLIHIDRTSLAKENQSG